MSRVVPRFRPKLMLMIVCNHAGVKSVIDVPEGYNEEDAALYMKTVIEQHKPFAEGTAAANFGQPKWYLMKMIGSAQREDLERV